jgi:hypothetical protein
MIMAILDTNEKARIETVSWNDVSHLVRALNPELAIIIDEISPDKSFKLYRCQYTYGTEIVKNGILQLPDNHGGTRPITSPNTPKAYQDDLSYNAHTNPVSLILNNSAEIFLSHQNHTLSLYGLVKPGNIFSTWIVLSEGLDSYASPFLWDMTAGARSFFMLSKISNQSGYTRLRKRFALTAEKPKYLRDQWYIFREIAQSSEFKQPWETDILFFGKKWFDHLTDPSFYKFTEYLRRTAWLNSDYHRNQFIWNFIYSTIQRKKNIKIDPYIAETVKHLFSMATGAASGFAPAINNIAAPVDGLKDIFNEIYRDKTYQPVFMQPYILGSDGTDRPAYYSLEYPSTMEFSSRSRDDKNKIQDLILIKSLATKYLSELANPSLNVYTTPIGKLNDTAEFTYFHSTPGYHAIENSKQLPSEDPAFQTSTTDDSRELPINSAFLRGCIRVTRKQDATLRAT